MERINQLNAERSQLYGLAGRGAGDTKGRLRVAEISFHLNGLWEERRRERVGQPDSIDQLGDREYRRIYGAKYDEAARPPAVAEAEDAPLALAAA